MKLAGISIGRRDVLNALMLLLAGTTIMVLVDWLGNRGFAVTYRWHSVLFHFGLLCLLFPVVRGLSALVGVNDANSRVLFSSVAICQIFLELAVRLSGTEATYTENRSGWYQSSYQGNLDDPLRVHRFYKEFWMETPEYRFHRKVNSHGFADDEFLPKQEGEFLIQTYGDSFTEGDGAPADSSYPALLRQMFAQRDMPSVKVQNFGFSGNDPGFYWRQFKDLGISMNPDLIVISYGSLDFTCDFFTRGGLSRFNDVGWSALPGPWWEFIYANSHLFRWSVRMLFGIDEVGFLLTPEQQRQRLSDLESDWNEVFRSIAELADEHGIDVLLVKKPERSEVALGEYQFDFWFFDSTDQSSENLYHFDLLEYYRQNRRLTADSTSRYYWVNDGHHNPRGYYLMAEGVFQALLYHFPSIGDGFNSRLNGNN
jgi:hypothetical protein